MEVQRQDGIGRRDRVVALQRKNLDRRLELTGHVPNVSARVTIIDARVVGFETDREDGGLRSTNEPRAGGLISGRELADLLPQCRKTGYRHGASLRHEGLELARDESLRVDEEDGQDRSDEWPPAILEVEPDRAGVDDID